MLASQLMDAELYQERIRPQDCTPGAGPVNGKETQMNTRRPYPDLEVPEIPLPRFALGRADKRGTAAPLMGPADHGSASPLMGPAAVTLLMGPAAPATVTPLMGPAAPATVTPLMGPVNRGTIVSLVGPADPGTATPLMLRSQ
jgi:hypothetical protein